MLKFFLMSVGFVYSQNFVPSPMLNIGLQAFQDCIYHCWGQSSLNAHVGASGCTEFDAHPVLTGRVWPGLDFWWRYGIVRRHWRRQNASGYRQEALRNFLIAVFPLPPEVLVLRNTSLFQQVLDRNTLLAALCLDFFDLFSCKHILCLYLCDKVRSHLHWLKYVLLRMLTFMLV